MSEVQRVRLLGGLGCDKASEGGELVHFRHEQARRNVFRGLLGHLHYMYHRIFGCWHRNMSLPLTRDGQTYRVCLRCGMRRHFHLADWKMKGRYYNDVVESTQSKDKSQPVEASTNTTIRVSQFVRSALRGGCDEDVQNTNSA